jgi:hypothetical protein
VRNLRRENHAIGGFISKTEEGVKAIFQDVVRVKP